MMGILNMNSPNSFIPPLIIMRKYGNISCGIGSDIKAWLAPEVMWLANAFVIYDPDGSLYADHASTFRDKNFNLATINFTTPNSYNPILNICDNNGVVKLTNALISATTGLGKLGDVNFLINETMLLNALISYIHHEAPKNEQNMAMLIMILEHMIIEDYQDGYISAVDLLFEETEFNEPWHTSVLLYNEFMDAVGDSGDAMRIAESCLVRLASFKTSKTDASVQSENVVITNLTLGNTALFVMDSNADDNCKFLVPLMYSQLYDANCKKPKQSTKIHLA
jgi:type IV secretion system protein VirD4